MEYLAAYDIADPKRLKKIARLMESYGIRVQKSVFEFNLGDSRMKALKIDIAKVIDETEDSVRIYPMFANSRNSQDIMGQGYLAGFPDCFIV
jgi:CRISPR-associated protein Cas2